MSREFTKDLGFLKTIKLLKNIFQGKVKKKVLFLV